MFSKQDEARAWIFWGVFTVNFVRKRCSSAPQFNFTLLYAEYLGRVMRGQQKLQGAFKIHP